MRAIVKKIEDTTIEKLKKNIITRYTIAKYFELSGKINKLIGESVEAGDYKGSLKFAFSFVILDFYFLIIGAILYIIKAILQWDPNFLEAYFLLLGAGIMAFIVWLKNLYQESKKLKALKQVGKKKFRQSFSRLMKIVTLFFGGFIWIFGEIVFIMLSKNYQDWGQPTALFGILYFILFVIILFWSNIFAKADPNLISDQEITQD